ncbi:hypothetical protein OESDEN_07587, partial [Oesophagostomum dentatum]
LVRTIYNNFFQKSVLSFKEKLEKDKKTAEAELQQALTKLPQFFRDYKQIAEDTRLTWKQAEEKRDQLVKKLTPKEQQAAAILSQLFAPVDESEARSKQYGPGAGGQYPQGQYGQQGQQFYGDGQY